MAAQTNRFGNTLTWYLNEREMEIVYVYPCHSLMKLFIMIMKMRAANLPHRFSLCFANFSWKWNIFELSREEKFDLQIFGVFEVNFLDRKSGVILKITSHNFILVEKFIFELFWTLWRFLQTNPYLISSKNRNKMVEWNTRKFCFFLCFFFDLKTFLFYSQIIKNFSS